MGSSLRSVGYHWFNGYASIIFVIAVAVVASGWCPLASVFGSDVAWLVVVASYSSSSSVLSFAPPVVVLVVLSLFLISRFFLLSKS